MVEYGHAHTHTNFLGLDGQVSDSELSNDEMSVLVGALGRFAMGMLVTYGRHADNIPAEVKEDFNEVVARWVAVAGEFLDIDAILEEAMNEGK